MIYQHSVLKFSFSLQFILLKLSHLTILPNTDTYPLFIRGGVRVGGWQIERYLKSHFLNIFKTIVNIPMTCEHTKTYMPDEYQHKGGYCNVPVAIKSYSRIWLRPK